ncbi:hypothetical protein HanRHA438_Chr07g0307241 [Helianthus annuus]|nr:hypothetical protein HanPI659440_Chr07g0264761 [Helianthus annuus]KAJ0908154.1 hypothetical protein HanRHA438_Chr07g0307241 [Helianthus annuus]
MKEMFMSSSQRLARFEYSFRFEIYVLLWIVTQDAVFESFGTVELVQLPTDETWNCKGFGFGFIQGCTEFERTAGDCRSNDEVEMFENVSVCGLHGRCLMKCLMG